MRVLALITDGFGGKGGIARYNRDFLSALAASPAIEHVLALPRSGQTATEEVPAKVRQVSATSGRGLYALRAAWLALSEGPFDFVFCGHLYMVPLAYILARLLNIPLWLQIHGIDAWKSPGLLAQWAAERASLVTAVSRYTRQRFLEWAGIDPARVRVLPNTFEPRFAPEGKPAYLAARYDTKGHKVLLTVSRLARPERYKGHDRVIAAMPAILKRHPNTIYIVAGDGDDRLRLECLATEKGVAHAVRFAGAVSDAELPDHYHLADIFVMPSKGEGFGIVFLEAAAAGLPVIAGNRDGSVDALADGAIGRLVDPDDPASVAEAIIAALDNPPGPARGYARFATSNFQAHVNALLDFIVAHPARLRSLFHHIPRTAQELRSAP